MRAPIVLLVALVLIPVPATVRASDGASSRSDGNSSNGSSEASNGSADASNASGDSSEASGDSSNSSKSSNNSDGSSDDSSEDSSQQSSDATSKGDGAKVITIAGAIILAGGLVAAGIGFGATTTRRNEQTLAEKRLEHFLRRHHSAVLRDVALARGPLLEGWTHEWGLTAAERERLLKSLDGSKEQVAMLRSMGRLDDPKSASRFAADLCAVAERALGETRIRAIKAR